MMGEPVLKLRGFKSAIIIIALSVDANPNHRNEARPYVVFPNLLDALRTLREKRPQRGRDKHF